MVSQIARKVATKARQNLKHVRPRQVRQRHGEGIVQ